ncbi:MAG: restriction endonuclease subunit S, partial [Chloroflexi bacterium]|nr:restriction endonuclease subunit S [Chloroflexota bacterium]
VDFLHEGEVGWGSTEFIVLRPKNPWPPEIGYLYARVPGFRDYAIVNMTGTSGRQRVPPEAVAAYAMPLPPTNAVMALGELVRTSFTNATRLADQSRKLARLRDTLLPHLTALPARVS